VDVQTLEAMYEKIGTPLTGGLKGYETSAARAAGDAVLAELLLKPAASGRAHDAVARTPGAAPQLTPAYHIRLTGKARMMVKFALEGALRRLARPQCQRLFTDFDDPAGHSLSDTLAAWGKTPGEVMAALYFVEGDDSTQCHADGTTAAFTVRGNRVIHVCGTRFVDRFARRTAGEILLIHELLHALGLGEDPPTSAHVTDAVLTRCGN
jgi:hypothetical protein